VLGNEQAPRQYRVEGLVICHFLCNSELREVALNQTFVDVIGCSCQLIVVVLGQRWVVMA